MMTFHEWFFGVPKERHRSLVRSRKEIPVAAPEGWKWDLRKDPFSTFPWLVMIPEDEERSPSGVGNSRMLRTVVYHNDVRAASKTIRERWIVDGCPRPNEKPLNDFDRLRLIIETNGKIEED